MPRDLNLAGVGVDAHLDELGSERVPGQRLLVLDLLGGVETGFHATGGDALGDQPAQLLARSQDRRAP